MYVKRAQEAMKGASDSYHNTLGDLRALEATRFPRFRLPASSLATALTLFVCLGRTKVSRSPVTAMGINYTMHADLETKRLQSRTFKFFFFMNPLVTNANNLKNTAETFMIKFIKDRKSYIKTSSIDNPTLRKIYDICYYKVTPIQYCCPLREI